MPPCAASWKLNKKDEANIRDKVEQKKRECEAAGMSEEDVEESLDQARDTFSREIKEEKKRRWEEKKAETEGSGKTEKHGAPKAVPNNDGIGAPNMAPNAVPIADYSCASSASSPMRRTQALPATIGSNNVDYLGEINQAVRTILAHSAFENIRSRAPLQITLTDKKPAESRPEHASLPASPFAIA